VQPTGAAAAVAGRKQAWSYAFSERDRGIPDVVARLASGRRRNHRQENSNRRLGL